MRIKNKWKRFAIGHVLADHSPKVNPVALYDLLEQTEDADLADSFDTFAVLVWQQFDNLPPADIVYQITELATRAQAIEDETDDEPALLAA